MTVSRLLVLLRSVPTDRPFLASDVNIPGPKLRAMADFGWLQKTSRDKSRGARWWWELTEDGRKLAQR